MFHPLGLAWYFSLRGYLIFRYKCYGFLSCVVSFDLGVEIERG